ncbi:MAG: YdeI/OmpD-associated family protein [Myxococcaceae bacterium]|nr:YdeI/OmpD-associated family protein [Myxococcaceae bacterium]MCI0670993.1 YdeI/OmpD-associated family protein [Myxococcaceae bacterium]
MARKTFEAVLEHSGVPGTWSTVRIPFDVEKAFGSRARVAVKGTVNGAPYQGSAMPMGDGTHFLVVNKTLQKEAGASAGDTLRVVMEPDTAPREMEVPEDLEAALKKDTAARSSFERMSYSSRKEYVDWILEAKKAETRQSRISKALVMIAAGKRLKG